MSSLDMAIVWSFFLTVQLFDAFAGCFLYERNGTYVPLSITGENNPVSGKIYSRNELFAEPRLLPNWSQGPSRVTKLQKYKTP